MKNPVHGLKYSLEANPGVETKPPVPVVKTVVSSGATGGSVCVVHEPRHRQVPPELPTQGSPEVQESVSTVLVGAF